MSQIPQQGTQPLFDHTAADVVDPHHDEGNTMTRGNVRTNQGREAEIRSILGRIVTCAADVAAISDAEPPELRMRHELAQDLLADACALAYATARARIERLEPDDVHLRHEAIEDATTGFGEAIQQVSKGLQRLKAGVVPAPAFVSLVAAAEVRSSEALLERVSRFAFSAPAVA